MIELESVSKRYPDGTLAVEDISLVAPSGRTTVLVGPSGCGKTTTLRMVNRMLEPTGGRILLDGTDTAAVDAATLRRGIGYVIQHAGLFPHRTVLDNVTTVPELLGWDRKRAKARASELLEQVGLEPALARRYPAQLSGGQRQRVGVARALAADPPVMLMDEPFSAVDPVVREQLQEEFLRLQAELSKTILFVTHDIDEAVKLGDQVCVLRVGGTVAQVAAPAELLADPVDDFVADFVGRDRGYRALSFVAAGRISLDDEPTVRVGAPAAEAAAAATDGWVLALDEAGRPQGWAQVSAIERTVTADRLHRGGTVSRVDGSLRALLDAALSSPTGRGVIADAEGRFLGTVKADDVLEHVGSVRGETVAEGMDQGAGAGEDASAPTHRLEARRS